MLASQVKVRRSVSLSIGRSSQQDSLGNFAGLGPLLCLVKRFLCQSVANDLSNCESLETRSLLPQIYKSWKHNKEKYIFEFKIL